MLSSILSHAADKVDLNETSHSDDNGSVNEQYSGIDSIYYQNFKSENSAKTSKEAKPMRKRNYQTFMKRLIDTSTETGQNSSDTNTRSSILKMGSTNEQSNSTYTNLGSAKERVIPLEPSLAVSGEGMDLPSQRQGALKKTYHAPKEKTPQYIPKDVFVPKMPDIIVTLPIKKEAKLELPNEDPQIEHNEGEKYVHA